MCCGAAWTSCLTLADFRAFLSSGDQGIACRVCAPSLASGRAETQGAGLRDGITNPGRLVGLGLALGVGAQVFSEAIATGKASS